MAIGEIAQGTIKPSEPCRVANRRWLITVNQGLTRRRIIATIAVYRIDNSLMLIERYRTRRQFSARSGMPCRHRQYSKARSKIRSGRIRSSRFVRRPRSRRARAPPHVELSLHHDLDFDRERMAGVRAERRLHRVPDLRLAVDLAAQHRRARARQAGHRDRPAGRRDPVPDAVRARSRMASIRKITWLGSCLMQLQRAAGGERFLAAREPGAVRRGLARHPAAAAAASAPRPDRSGEDAEGHRRAGQSVLRARASRRTSTTPI